MEKKLIILLIIALFFLTGCNCMLCCPPYSQKEVERQKLEYDKESPEGIRIFTVRF